MIPENFNNKDTVFHYCKTKTAIEHILFNREIRLSPRNNSNDPIENISFKISESIAITDNNIEARTKKASIELNKNLSKKLGSIKQACFCRNNNSKKGTNEQYGFLKPRMWDQYGDNYKGVCIAFDKKKLLKNQKIKLKGKIKYLTYSDLDRDYLEIDRNALDKRGSQYSNELMNYANKLLLRKHIDYQDEREYRICVFGKNKYEYINIENSINGLIIIPELINEYTHKSFLKYSRDLKIPLIYLTLTAEGVKIDRV